MYNDKYYRSTENEQLVRGVAQRISSAFGRQPPDDLEIYPVPAERRKSEQNESRAVHRGASPTAFQTKISRLCRKDHAYCQPIHEPMDER